MPDKPKLHAAAITAMQQLYSKRMLISGLNLSDLNDVIRVITAAYEPLLTAVQGVLGAGLCGCENETQKAANRALQAALDAIEKGVKVCPECKRRNAF